MIPVLLTLNLIFVLFAGYALLSQRRKINILKEHGDALSKQMDQINKDYPLLVNADLVFSRQLREVNKQLISIDNQLQELENKRDNDGGYQHALRILEMGGNRDEIVNSCHLSSAEAELLMNLQAYRSAIKSQAKSEATS